MLSSKYGDPGRRSATCNVTLLLDMSGSMSSRRDATIREVNRYLDQLRRDGQRYRLTVKTFNDEVQTLISGRNIRDVGQLEHSEYRPGGWTRLLDAVGESLSSLSHWDHRNLFVVVTDGQENRSRNYGLHQVRDMIENRRSEDCQFVFLGDGPSAWQVGNSLGFNYSVATNWYDPRNSENIYNGLYTATNSLSAGQGIQCNMFKSSSTSAKKTDEG